MPARWDDAERAEARLRLAVEAAGLGFWEIDVATGEARFDERVRAMHGRCDLADPAVYLNEIAHPGDREIVRRAIAETRAGRLSVSEYRIIRPDGEVRWLRCMGLPLVEAGVITAVMGGSIDVTAERSRPEWERQAEKRSAIGTLAAGIAHNFNNLFTVMMGICDEVREVIPASHRADLDDAKLAVSRGAELIDQLLAFAGRPCPGTPAPFRLDESLRRAVTLCEPALGEATRLTVHPMTARWVNGHADGLEQLMVNLLLNAGEAVDGGEQPAVEVTVLDGPRPGQAIVRVRDNGPGMTDAVAARVFEPFFTTKGAVGTGLGLSTSAAIAREHGGTLSVRSAPGRGTTFELTLPTIPAPEV